MEEDTKSKTSSETKVYYARLPLEMFKRIRHFAAEEDLSTNMAICVLLEQGLDKEGYGA